MERPWPRQALTALCLAGAAACFCLPISNPDVFWHLSAARWMAAHRAWPRADWLSWTMQGRPWADFEWGAQLLWYPFFLACGFAGLWIAKAAAFAAAAAILWKALGLYGAQSDARSLGVLAWALAESPANDLRPENFSLLLFLVLWTLLEARRLGRLNLSASRLALGLSAFFCLWANLHAGFLCGLALLAIFAAADWLLRGDRGLAACAPLCATAALFNPYGWGIYLISLDHGRRLPELERYVREWQRTGLRDPWLWPFWALLVAALAAALARELKRRDLPPEHLGALGLFGISAAAHVRVSVYFTCIAVPILFEASKRLRPERIGARAAKSLVFAACSAFFLGKVAPALARAEFSRLNSTPAGLADFLEAQRPILARLRMFNPWQWGGYLGYRLGPDYRIFADGRYIFHSLLGPAHAARQDPAAFADFTDRLGIELVVLEHNDQSLRGQPFYLFFLPKRTWALVYEDRQGYVFVRREAAQPAWLRAQECP